MIRATHTLAKLGYAMSGDKKKQRDAQRAAMNEALEHLEELQTSGRLDDDGERVHAALDLLTRGATLPPDEFAFLNDFSGGPPPPVVLSDGTVTYPSPDSAEDLRTAASWIVWIVLHRSTIRRCVQCGKPHVRFQSNPTDEPLCSVACRVARHRGKS